MNKRIELIGVDQKVYALGRHEPFRDAESLKTIYFRCHGTDRDTHVGLFGQLLNVGNPALPACSRQAGPTSLTN